MSNWFENLQPLYAQVWRSLARGVTDRDAPARQPTLATISPDGWPESRTVVLRRAAQEQALLEIYTDNHSGKIASLRAIPRAALHVWEPDLNLQLRLQAKVAIFTGDTVANRWTQLTATARESYGITPAPGTAIPDALDYVKKPDQSHFCVLSLNLTHIDVLHLGDRHRRATFRQSQDWQGQWVAP